MGFDLHGISPVKTTSNAIDPDSFEGWKEDAEAGIYFRNNVWYWRPLWEYVAIVCDDILTLKDYKYGQSNDGDIIEAEKAINIGERLRISLAEGHYDKIVEEINENVPSIAKDYTFDKENVEEFANFCINSGGFSIC